MAGQKALERAGRVIGHMAGQITVSIIAALCVGVVSQSVWKSDAPLPEASETAPSPLPRFSQSGKIIDRQVTADRLVVEDRLAPRAPAFVASASRWGSALSAEGWSASASDVAAAAPPRRPRTTMASLPAAAGAVNRPVTVARITSAPLPPPAMQASAGGNATAEGGKAQSGSWLPLVEPAASYVVSTVSSVGAAARRLVWF